MAVDNGGRVGPYEIIGTLGAGGMGVVYRATDTRLKRDVALKILPESFATDRDRLARFQREAEVLASLNHPNIAAIYGFEESDSIRGLVMELVEGPTLADRIAQGPIPTDEALPIAKQIAEALEAAHEQGIIHRDLKPANIKLRPDGVVKVLDFGLAKALEPTAARVDATASPTITSPAMMTGVGMLLGTAAYMSPEQARGKPVDKRTDIWAFGCVLYEMLTGRRAFEGDDVAETLAAVLKQQPPWNEIPLSVQRLLKSCLENDPKRRLRDIADAWHLLEQPGSPTAHVAAPQQSRVRRWLWPSVAALAAMGALLVAFAAFRKAEPDTRVFTFAVAPPSNGAVDSFAISPDGRALAIAAMVGGRRSLWVRGLDSMEARELSGTDGAQIPFWSPDSRFIGFTAQGKLKRIAANGGPVQSLTDVNGIFPAAWNGAGTILFQGRLGMSSVAADGGIATPVKIERTAPALHPAFMPDGRRFLYSITQGDQRGVYVGTLGSEESLRLLAEISANAAYVAPVSGQEIGYVLFVREDTLMAQPVHPETLQAAREMFPIAEQILSPGGTSRYAYSVSANGTLVYQSGWAVNAERRLAWFDRAGKELGSGGQPGRIMNFALSPDEQRVAVARQGSQANHWDLWIGEWQRGTEVRFTSNVSMNRDVVWAPNGGQIIFSSTRAGRTDLYQKLLGGTTQEEAILTSGSFKIASDWSRDGSVVIYSERGDVFALRPGTNGRPVAAVQTQFSESHGQLSPDGRWLAYVSNESGRDEVFVQPFAIDSFGKAFDSSSMPTTGKWLISRGGGTEPRWRGDGKELFWLSEGKLMSVLVTTIGSNFQADGPRPLFDVPPLALPLPFPSYRYAVTADGKRFLVLIDPRDAAQPPLTVIVNWQTTLKQ